MAGKYDKASGVFIIEDLYTEDGKKVYIGKSNSVGVAIRSAKSKLKKGKFHNPSLQEDFIEGDIEDFKFHDPILLPEGTQLDHFHRGIKDSWTDKGFLIHNDISYVDREVDVESYLDLKGLTSYEKGFVKEVVDKISKIDIDYLRSIINDDNE